MEKKRIFIEIAGAPGVGKTSLAQVFNEKRGFTCAVESDEALDRLPFVKPYMSNPTKFGLEGNMNFFAFHFNNLQSVLHGVSDETPVISDWSAISQHAFGKSILNPDELATIEALIGHVYKKLPKVDLIIHPYLPIEDHMARIAQRGRAVDKDTPRTFLEGIQSAMESSILKLAGTTPVLRLNSAELNWASNDDDKNVVIQRAYQAMGL